jgi:hypothetical protein
MRPYNVTYLIPSTTLTVSQTYRDIFDADALLKRTVAEVPAGLMRLIKDVAISCTARRDTWNLWAGRELLSSGDALFVAQISQQDLRFVPDLDIPILGGTRLAMLNTSDGTLANATLHLRSHDYGIPEFQALVGRGMSLADL